MRKTAVIFPGVGYTKDRPLLYYSGKLAVRNGYELVFMDFGGIDWSKDKLKDRDFLLRTLDTCMGIAEEKLSGRGDMSGDDLVFISKSIGTVVATAYAQKKGLRAKQICFSPLDFIGNYVGPEGAELFCGDNDPYADFASVGKIAKEKGLRMHRIAGGNHSLETGDPITDIDNLKTMMQLVEKMLTDSYS